MNELLEKQPAAQDWTPSWEPQEATRISAALNLSEAATSDDRISAANVLLQARLPGQPFDPTGASLFSGKTPDPAQFYDSARKLFEIGPESIMTPELKEWLAVQDDEEKALAIARKKRGTFANLAEKFGDAVAGPFRPLSDAELAMADDEVKAANAIIKGRRDYEMGATAAYSGRKTPTEEQPAIAPGSPEFDAAAKKVEEHRQNLLDRSAIAEYQSQLFADNVWYQYQLVRGKLDPDTDAIVKDAFTHKTMTPAMADKFRNLKDGDQQRLAASLIYGAKLQGDRQLLWDSARAFADTLIDVPKDAAESLFVDSVKRLVMDDATYQKQAETEAILAQAEAPRMAEYGYWGNALIGTASTLPYMGYAMIPYAGNVVMAAQAAKQFERRVAAEGGDVTSAGFQAAKWSSAIAYAAVEKMQALRIGGPITDLQKRQAFLHFWRKANAAILAKTVAENTIAETWEEGVQQGIEEGFTAWGLDKEIAGPAAEGLVTGLKDSAGTMFLTSLAGVGVQGVRGRVTRNHTLNEIVAGSLHASALIDAHKANDAEAVAKHRAALASLSRQVRDAGSPDNAIDQLVRQGVDPVHATMLTMYLQQEAVAIQRDAGLTQSEKDELLGRDRQAVDVMRDLMPDAQIEENRDADGKFDGSFTINRTVAGVKTSTRVTTVENVEYDLSTPEATASALKRLNEYGAEITPEAWKGMSDDEKRGKLTEFGLIKAANFKFDAPGGASVTDGQLKVLTGEIKFSRGMHAATLFHEYFHAMTEYLTKTKVLEEADFVKLREEFGPPAEGVDEQFNEETAADRFRDYAAKLVHFTESSALEKIWDATVDLLSKAKAMLVKPRQPGTIEDAIFQQVISGEYTGIPVATVRKSKETAQEPPAPAAQQAQAAPESETHPTTATEQKPPLNANVGPDFKPGGANFDSLKAKDQQKVADKEASYDMKPGEWRATTPRGNIVFGGTDGFVDASHLMSSENPAYPAKRQPRDRNNIEARIQHEEIYREMDAQRLFESQETDGGSVITDTETAVDPEDGLQKEIIDSGNGRMNAIKIAIKEGTFEEKYGTYARMRAKRMGIDVSGMKYPIYRRRIEWVQKSDQRIHPTEADMDSFVELSNVPKILKRNESEMAEADAKMLIAKGLLKLFQPGIAGNIMAVSNAPFMVAFVRAAGASDLVNSDGHPTDLAERRVKRALLALLIGEGKTSREIIRALTENAQEMGMGTVVDGVLKSIGDIVGISQAKPTLSIVDATGMALRDYLEMKIAGYTSAQDWVNQGDFFNPRPEAVKSLVQAFHARANTSVGIAAIFRDYAAKARLVDTSTSSLGMAETDTMESILDRAIADTAKEAQADAKAQDNPSPADTDKATVPPPPTVAKRQEEAKKQAKPELHADPQDFGVKAMPVTDAMRESVVTEGQARFSFDRPWTPKTGGRLYHGTPARDFSKFKGDYAYLAEDPSQTEPFASGFLTGTDTSGTPRVIAVDAAPGKMKDISDVILEALMEGDIDKTIMTEAKKARKQGYRYLSHEHPGVQTDNDFTAIISLYPQEDLRIAVQRDLDGIQRDSQGGIERFSFEKVGPTLSRNNAAIASLAVQKLAGREIGTEQAARAMYLFKPEGATAEQLLADANRMADSAVGQAAKRALEGKDPTKAMTMIAVSAETDSLVAARAGAIEGGKTALRMGKLAARGENAALKQLLIAAKGENLQQFEIDTGISWTETLLSFLPEKWKEWEDEAKKDEKPEGPQQAEAQPVPPTAEELADREKRMIQLIEAAKAWDADRRAKLEKAQADKKAEEGEGSDGETEDMSDPEAAIPAIPKELLEAHGVDLTSPEAVAHAIRLWIGDWIVRNSNGRLLHATVWLDPEAVEIYRKTIRQQLEDMASKLLDPTDYGPIFVARMIGDLPTTGRPDTFERRSAMIIGSIQAHAIRQSRRELVNGIRKTIDSLAKQGKKFDPMEEDLKRKVSAEPEALARYIKRVIGWGSDKCHAELEKLQASLESRRALYEKEHGYLDAEFDAEIRRDEIRLNMLARWGNLKSMLPAEIKAAGEEITQWLSSEQERLQREWFAQAEANGNMMTAILEGVVPVDQAKARKEPGAAQQFIEAHTYMVRQRLEALLRHGDPAKRAAAMQAIEEVMFQMSRGTEVYEATRLKYRQQWDQAVLDATKDRNGKIDRNAAAQWMKHLDEAIPAEVSTAISRQGFNGTMTYGQAIQLYVGLTQRFYADNVIHNKRTDHAKRIEAILSPADLKMVYRLRDIYEQRRAELSAVVRKVTGLDVWRPDPLYMPVQMYLGSRGGLGTAGNVRAWKSLSDALTPRVRNNRDFDESVDIQSMFFQRMEDTARAIGYGVRGLTIRGVLGKKDLHDTIERYYGKQPVRELMKHITQTMAGLERQGEGEVESVLAMIRKTNTYMALSFNLLSMAKQVGSMPAFMFKMGAGDFITAITQYDAASWAELKDSDGYKARYMGGIAPEVMEILDDPSQGKIKRAYKAGMVTVQAGDYLAAKIVATGIYKAKATAMINAGMGVQQAKERAKTETWSIVEETQQSGRTENVAGVYRNYGEMAKLVFQFASAPLMQLSHEYHAAMDAKAGVDGAKERLVRAVLLNHVIIPGIMSAIAWAFNSLLLGDEPPEDRDSILEVVANNLMFEPLSRILVVGSVMEALGNSILKGKLPGFSNDIPASRLARTAGYAGRSVYDLFTQDWEQFQSDILEVAKQASAPVRHISNFYENRMAQ